MDNENKGTSANSHDCDDNTPTSQQHPHDDDDDDEVIVDEDKWEHALHPYQEPYWTGRPNPAEYLDYLQNVTLPQFRRTRRKRDLILLRQAELVVWQVELMNRAYQDTIVVVVSPEENVETTTAAADEEKKHHDHSPASTSTFAPTDRAASLATTLARQRYNDCRQEALEERLEFIRLRKRHFQGKNHYKFAMQHLPIPEPLADGSGTE